MGRSLFAKLHRRYGRRISGDERRLRAEKHLERLRQACRSLLISAWAESALNQGTTIYFTLPRRTEFQPAEATS